MDQETPDAGAEPAELSLRDQLLAARDEVAERETPEAEAPEQSAAERARDEQGRFAAKETAPEPAPTPERAPVVEAAPEPKHLDPALAAAPPAWSNMGKAKWAGLDPEVRAEILKRESDVHKGFTKLDTEREFGRELQKVIAPYEAMIRAEGGTPAAAVAQLLNTAYTLRAGDSTAKTRAIANICQQYGIDLSQVSAQSPQQLPPEVGGLYQKVNQLEGLLQQQQQAQEQLKQTQVLRAIETFSKDPKHKFFEQVREDMGRWLQANPGESRDLSPEEMHSLLAQVYDSAVWARPDLRSQLLAETTAQQTKEVKERARTEKARAKAVSVRGGPGGFTTPNPSDAKSVREALEAAFAEHAGRI